MKRIVIVKQYASVASTTLAKGVELVFIVVFPVL